MVHRIGCREGVIVHLRVNGRLLLQVAAGLGAVLFPASPLREPSAAPVPRQLVQSSPPPAGVSVSADFCVEPPALWNAPVVVATTPVPTDLSASAGVRLDDSVAIPEPSVILLLLGGAGIAIVLRRPRGVR